MADHSTTDADALLTWYRAAGRCHARDVRLHLARRAIAADWPCTAQQAAAIIEATLVHVLTRRAPCAATGARDVAMRKDVYLQLRATASAWLRAGVMEAEWRYGAACA